MWCHRSSSLPNMHLYISRSRARTHTQFLASSPQVCAATATSVSLFSHTHVSSSVYVNLYVCVCSMFVTMMSVFLSASAYVYLYDVSGHFSSRQCKERGIDGRVGPRTGSSRRIVLAHCAGTRTAELLVGDACSDRCVECGV